MSLPVAKLHGAGNGYIVIDGRTVERDWPSLVRAMATAHTGVGSDGLLVVQNATQAQVRMRVFNSDGSEAEMSGNGIRILAKFVVDRGIAQPHPEGLKIETLSSGTCSTAAAIAARLYGHTNDQVCVHLPGGKLDITWPGMGEAYLEGPVEEIYTGTWPH